MAIENVVGSAAIIIDPILDRAGMQQFQRQMRAIGSAAAKGANRAMMRDFGFDSTKAAGALTPAISEAVAKQRLKARKQLKGLTSDLQHEIRAQQSLDRQRTSSLKKAETDQARILRELSDHYDKEMKAQRAATRYAEQGISDFRKQADQMFTNAVRSGAGLDAVNKKTASLGKTMSSVGHLHAANFMEGMYKAGSALSQIGTRVGMLGFQMQLLGRQMSTFVSLPIAAAAGGSMAVGLKQAAAIESAMRGMVALNPNENIVPFFRSMLEFAEKSPVFEAGPLLDAIRGLSAAGLETAKIDKIVRAMGNIGLTVGVEPEQMSRAFYAIKQIVTKGRVYAEELRQQLGDAIPGIDSLLAEGMGMTGKQLQDLLEDKKFSADMFVDAIIKIGNSSRFLEGAKTGVETLNAAWSSFKETLKNTLAMQLMDENFVVKAGITNGIQNLTKALESLINTLGEAGVFEAIIAGFTKFVQVVEKAVVAYDNMSAAQQAMIPKIALAAAAFGPLLQVMGFLFSTAAAGIGAMGTLGITVGSLATPVGAAAIAVVGLAAAVGTGFAVAYAKVEVFRKKMGEVATSLVNFFDNHIAPAMRAVHTEILRLGSALQSIGLDWEFLGDVLLWIGRIVLGSLVVSLKVTQGLLFGLRAVITGVAWVWNQFLNEIRSTVGWLVKLIEVLPGDAFAEQAGPLDEMWRGMRDFANSTAGSVDTSKMWNDAQSVSSTRSFELSGALGTLGGMFDMNTQKVQTLNGVIDEYIGKLNAAEAAQSATKAAGEKFKIAQDALKQSVQKNGAAINDNSKAAKENRAKLKAATQASFEKMLMDIKSGVPMDQAIKRHKDRTKALQGEFGKSEKAKKETGRYIDKLKLVPKDVRTLLTMIGYKDVDGKLLEILAKQKAAKQGTSWTNELSKLKRASANPKTSSGIGGFAEGGWTGPGSKYQPAGVVHADEHVIRKEARKKLEGQHPGLLDYMNQYGRVPGKLMYAGGGRVTWPFPVNVKGTLIKKSWGDLVPGIGNSKGGNGWRWMVSVLNKAFNTNFGIREADPNRSFKTLSGNTSYHSMGRAVDLPPRRQYATWILGHYGRTLKELITPWRELNYHNGRPHRYSPAVERQHGVGSAGNDHVHWAHDRGGPLLDGMLTRNSSGQSEMVLNAAQGAALERRLEPDDPPIVKVYIGDQELKGIVRVEVDQQRKKAIGALNRGRGGRG